MPCAEGYVGVSGVFLHVSLAEPSLGHYIIFYKTPLRASYNQVCAGPGVQSLAVVMGSMLHSVFASTWGAQQLQANEQGTFQTRLPDSCLTTAGGFSV